MVGGLRAARLEPDMRRPVISNLGEFGDERDETGDTTRAVNTYALLNGMEFLKVPPGRIRVAFSSSVEADQNNAEVFVAWFVDDVEDADTRRQMQAAQANVAMVIASHAHIELTAESKLDVRWRVESSGGGSGDVGTMHHRTATWERSQ